MQTITEKQILNKLTPQRQTVLVHLNRLGVITKNYAAEHYGIKNLAEIIRRIRKLDVDIETITMDNDVVYELKQEKQNGSKLDANGRQGTLSF